MFSDTMAPVLQDLQTSFPAQSTTTGEAVGVAKKWSVAARLRLIILPTAVFWGAAIWLVVSLI
jgi:hypothetical protein